MTKPFLRRQCPLCGGPMAWCGDTPMHFDDGITTTTEETHVCDEILCTKCELTVRFNSEDLRGFEDMDELLQAVADKWNKAL